MRIHSRIIAVKQRLMDLYDTHHQNGVHGPSDGTDITHEYETRRNKYVLSIDTIAALEYPHDSVMKSLRLLNFYFSNRMTSVVHKNNNAIPKYTNARDRYYNYISFLNTFNMSSIECIEAALSL